MKSKQERPKMREAVMKGKGADFMPGIRPRTRFAASFCSSFSLLPVLLEYECISFVNPTRRRFPFLPRLFCGEWVAWEESETRIETNYVEAANSLLCPS
jgi:hypothetical protein